MSGHDRKLGRLPREHDPAVPHMSALIAGKELPAPPPLVDYVTMMPQAPGQFGMMLNDKLGDCMCAAYYHARQVWTFHSKGAAEAADDHDVELLYERACGYKIGEAGEGPGGSLQGVLRYIHKHGAPLTPHDADRILGFVEVDPQHADDVKRAIYHSGIAMLGLDLPENISPLDGYAPQIWTIALDAKIIGGHAVIAAGYDAEYLAIVSWGTTYKMAWDFFAKYVDEVYAVSDRAWHESPLAKSNGLTLPAGLSPEAYAEHMQPLMRK